MVLKNFHLNRKYQIDWLQSSLVFKWISKNLIFKKTILSNSVDVRNPFQESNASFNGDDYDDDENFEGNDHDASKFEEDGSFIGVYSKKNSFLKTRKSAEQQNMGNPTFVWAQVVNWIHKLFIDVLYYVEKNYIFNLKEFIIRQKTLNISMVYHSR